MLNKALCHLLNAKVILAILYNLHCLIFISCLLKAGLEAKSFTDGIMTLHGITEKECLT